MATLTKGKTFGATETVTNTKLHQLIDSGSVSDIDGNDFDLSKASPVIVQSGAPSAPQTGTTWFDTTNNVLRIYDGTKFQMVAFGRVYTNNSGAQLDAGDAVILDIANDESVTTTTSANNVKGFGVAMNTASDAADVVVITDGYVPSIKVTGATTPGQYLATSTTVKKVDPNTAIVSGAFAIALSTSSTSVSAKVGTVGAAQAVPGAETFQWEAGRDSMTSGGSTITFTTAFTIPPVVVVSPESTTVSLQAGVESVTTTNFVGAVSTNTTCHWFACSAGTWKIGDHIIQAGAAGRGDGLTHHIPVYSTGFTPAIMMSAYLSDTPPVIGDGGTHVICGRPHGQTSTPGNFAGTASMVEMKVSANNASGLGVMYVLVSQTSTVKTGNSATADGTQGTLGTTKFEAGHVGETSSVSPSITYATAFSTNPVMIVGGENRENVGSNAAQVNAQPSTTAGVIRCEGTGAGPGYNWFAIDDGAGSVSNATRVA